MSRSPLDQIQASLRGRLADLDDLERAFLTLRPQLDGRAGAAAIDVAVDRIGTVRQAVDQALEEIEVEDGLYAGAAEPPFFEPRVVDPEESATVFRNRRDLPAAWYAELRPGGYAGPFAIRQLADRAVAGARKTPASVLASATLEGIA